MSDVQYSSPGTTQKYKIIILVLSHYIVPNRKRMRKCNNICRLRLYVNMHFKH